MLYVIAKDLKENDYCCLDKDENAFLYSMHGMKKFMFSLNVAHGYLQPTFETVKLPRPS